MGPLFCHSATARDIDVSAPRRERHASRIELKPRPCERKASLRSARSIRRSLRTFWRAMSVYEFQKWRSRRLTNAPTPRCSFLRVSPCAST